MGLWQLCEKRWGHQNATCNQLHQNFSEAWKYADATWRQADQEICQGMFDKHSSRFDFTPMLTNIYSVGMLSLLLDELLWCDRARFHIAARIRFRRVEVVLKNSAEVLNPSASTLRVWDQPNLRVVAWLFVASVPLMVLWRMRGRHRPCACYYRLEGPWKSRSAARTSQRHPNDIQWPSAR